MSRAAVQGMGMWSKPPTSTNNRFQAAAQGLPDVEELAAGLPMPGESRQAIEGGNIEGLVPFSPCESMSSRPSHSPPLPKHTNTISLLPQPPSAAPRPAPRRPATARPARRSCAARPPPTSSRAGRRWATSTTRSATPLATMLPPPPPPLMAAVATSACASCWRAAATGATYWRPRRPRAARGASSLCSTTAA